MSALALKANKNTLRLLAMLPIASLFFIGGPNAAALPWLRYAWNLGHIGFFFVATWAFCLVFPSISRDKPWRYLAAILVASLIIEVIQFLIGRNLSAFDIARNLTGAALALGFLLKDKIPKSILIFGLLFILFDVSLFTKVAIRDWHYQHRHPIIENFESSNFMSYWPQSIARKTNVVYDGHFAGYVSLAAGQFSGIKVSPVLRDWSSYTAIHIALFNSQEAERPMTIRMHDVVHELSKQQYSDRFNKTVLLQPGWNSITIPLEEVVNTPGGRKMDLTKMHQIGVFYSGLEQPDYLVIDDIQLTDMSLN